ncbi:MAG: hypothetical protein ACI9VR_001453 [Cognaticolwellia sp.]|jgi:hypothetical protein
MASSREDMLGIVVGMQQAGAPKSLMVVIAILLLVLIGGGVWWQLRDEPAPEPETVDGDSGLSIEAQERLAFEIGYLKQEAPAEEGE